MGTITFTKIQKKVFDSVVQHPSLPKTFYFTGGTALSAVYLHHRESEDLDFFSEKDFENEPILDVMKTVSSSFGLPYRFTQKYHSRIFELVKQDNLLIKIDFVYQPYKRLKSGLAIREFPVDSLLDIATNKLLTVNQRDEVKDFVDLYFLLKKFTIWDLFYAVKEKYGMELDIILTASDLLKINNFDYLPRMIKPLTLDKLKLFFREKAKELGRKSIE